MATNLTPVLRQRFFSANGAPLAGGKLYSYQAGTTTPQATYTDSTGGTPNANPVILDANGEANVWLDPTLSYKFILKDSSDVQQWTVDNVIGLLTANAAATASMQDGSVTTAKLADDAVDSTKLKDDTSIDANRAVTRNHLRDGVVTAEKLADGFPQERSNVSLSASVATNALTIALKTRAGSDPSATSPVVLTFRNSTASIGTYTRRTLTAALSITVPSGTTIGTTNGQAYRIYVFALDNAGSVELAVSLSPYFDGNYIVTTSAVAGGSSATTIYSTTARTGVAITLLGAIDISEATAGTWSSSPTNVATGDVVPKKQVVVGAYDTSTRQTNSTTYIVAGGPLVSITPIRTGLFKVYCSLAVNAGSGNSIFVHVGISSGSPLEIVAPGVATSGASDQSVHVYGVFQLTAGTAYQFGIAFKSASSGTNVQLSNAGVYGGAALVVEELY